ESTVCTRRSLEHERSDDSHPFVSPAGSVSSVSAQEDGATNRRWRRSQLAGWMTIRRIRRDSPNGTTAGAASCGFFIMSGLLQWYAGTNDRDGMHFRPRSGLAVGAHRRVTRRVAHGFGNRFAAHDRWPLFGPLSTLNDGGQ